MKRSQLIASPLSAAVAHYHANETSRSSPPP